MCRTDGTQLRRILINIWEKLYRESVNRLYLPQEILQKRVPYYLVSFVVAIMSAYFFIVQREDVLAWLKKVAPVSVQKRMTLVSDNLKYALGGYFKAQFKIMGVVF